MSKTSIRSKASIRSFYRQKKKKNVEEIGKKQYGFCCAIGDYDPLAKYDKRNPPFKSSLTSIHSVHECPVLKVRTQFIEHGFSKKKGIKTKTGSSTDRSQWTSKSKSTSAPGTLLRFIEDDIQLAIEKQVNQKKKAYKEEVKKNIIISKKKAKAELAKKKKVSFPRWYQDFSNLQMKHLIVLKDALCADYEEKETYRTRKTLTAIGIISTCFKLDSNQIKTLQHISNIKPVNFLRETYKTITGTDFEAEGHKNDYNCNERLILSAIAFLTLPETIIELNDRLPPVENPKFPPKPKPPQVVYPQQMDCPYKEKLFQPPNLRLYQIELHKWRRKCEMIPRPKVILPPKEKSPFCEDAYRKIQKETGQQIDRQKKEIQFSNVEEESFRSNRKKNMKQFRRFNRKQNEPNQQTVQNVISKTKKKQFDFTLSGLGEGVGPVQYKIRGTLDPSEQKQKSWLGEKELHYVISGINNENDPPQGPVTFELSGISKVTPNNSDEDFFAKLKLGDGPNKIYPRGRKYLSKNWQEWLQNVDEEFIKVENEANKLIASVEATMRLVVPGPTCDTCCACRQTKKTHLKKRATKTPHMVIESIAEDNDEKRYIVGSLSMQSPAPSLAESTVNLLEVVSSYDKVTKNFLINGVTNDNGETIYYISGVSKDIQHVPEEKIERSIPKTIKNVPPCACAIEKMFNEGLDQEPSNENIPFTKDDSCFGKKYRPNDFPAYTCQQYSGKKYCGGNPFQKMLEENRRKAKSRKSDKDFYPPDTVPVTTQIVERKSSEDDIKDMKLASTGYDDEIDWNAKRTAPSAKEVLSLYERGLNLTQAHPQPSETIRRYKDDDKGGQMNSENKKLKKIENERDSKQPISSQFIPAKSVSRNEINRKNDQSKRTNNKNQMSRPISNLEKKVGSIKNDLKVNKIGNKRSVTSAKKFTRMTRNKQKNENSKDGKRKLDNRSINSAKKLSALKSSKIANRGKDFSEKYKLGSVQKLSRKDNKTKLEKPAKKKTNTENQSKQEQMKQLKEEMKNFKLLQEIPYGVNPEENLKSRKRERKYEESELQSLPAKNDQVTKKEGPFGWRTESEQKLAPEKTLIYLAEPTQPIESVAVRPGGKPCHCRENRNKKKILIYNIGGLVQNPEEKRKKVKNVSQVIEGITYITPPLSPRRSDEYIPEYELYESPYDMCVRQKKDDTLKLTEKFIGLPSLKSKKPENNSSCGCGYKDEDEIHLIENKNQFFEKNEAASTEWANALKDAGLIDHFSKCQDDIPCWLKCSQFSKSGCCDNVKKLQVKKPVCECKYERKIVKRNEDKKNWLDRQKRFKTYKKVPFTHVAGISRPMETEKKFIISGVKRIPKENENDEVKYCVSGIAENNIMGPVQYVIDGVNLQTPIVTPKPSDKEFPCVCAHKHWSVTQLPENVVRSEENEHSPKAKENHNGNGPRRCNDATKCKELASIRVNYAFKGKSDTANNEEYKNQQIKMEGKKIKGRRKDGITNSVIVRSQHVNEQTEVQSDSRTPEVKHFLDDPNSGKNQSEFEMNKNDKEQSHSKPIAGTKEIKKYDAADKVDLALRIKNELQEMAAEGFTFAQLPNCHRMPQIQYWIMYRKGALFTEKDKDKMIQQTRHKWTDLSLTDKHLIDPPAMNSAEKQTTKLDYGRAIQLKREIAAKKSVFYSQIRQGRVKKSAALWNTMEFGKFPSLSFKETFFTYLPSKEADGHILEPQL